VTDEGRRPGQPPCTSSGTARHSTARHLFLGCRAMSTGAARRSRPVRCCPVARTTTDRPCQVRDAATTTAQQDGKSHEALQDPRRTRTGAGDLAEFSVLRECAKSPVVRPSG
jgi:hypothetical protein